MDNPKVKEAIQKADEFIQKYPNLFQYSTLKKLEDQTGYSKVYFLLVIIVTIFIFIYGAGGSKLISDLVCFVYPAYMSFKAIDSQQIEDDMQWLTYWIVFSTMAILETTNVKYLFEYVPFYFFLKIAFMIWLYHPKYQGAIVVYSQVLRPLVLPYIAKVSP